MADADADAERDLHDSTAAPETGDRADWCTSHMHDSARSASSASIVA
jgi:hypothetical protein